MCAAIDRSRDEDKRTECERNRRRTGITVHILLQAAGGGGDHISNTTDASVDNRNDTNHNTSNNNDTRDCKPRREPSRIVYMS